MRRMFVVSIFLVVVAAISFSPLLFWLFAPSTVAFEPLVWILLGFAQAALLVGGAFVAFVVTRIPRA